MPKNILKISNFTGGLNSNTDKQNIQDNELSLSDGVDTFDNGKIKLLNKFTDSNYEGQTIPNPGHIECYPGKGLFHFKADKSGANIHHIQQYGTVASLTHNGTSESTIKIDYESTVNSQTPLNAWVGSELIIRDGHTNNNILGAKALITGSVLASNSNIYITYSSEGYPVNMHQTGEQIPTSARVMLISKNESIDYLVKYYNERDGLDFDSGEQGVQLWDSKNNFWGPLEFGYSHNLIKTTHPKPTFYYVDGGLRWCDGEGSNISTTSTNKFLGYIKTQIEHNTAINQNDLKRAYAAEVNMWVHSDQKLTQPVKGTSTGQINLSAGSPGTQGIRVNAIFNYGNDEQNIGTWSNDGRQYKFYASYVYKNGGESKLTSIGEAANNLDFPTNLGLEISWNVDDFPVDKRIVGVKIYWSKTEGNYFTSNSIRNYLLLGEFNLEKGWRASTEVSWDKLYFEAYDVYEHLKSRPYIFENPPVISSYESELGHEADDVFDDIRFETAVVANRRIYIGNVNYDGKQYEDAIIKSPVNQFDVFPIANKIEVTRLDGSRIVKLEEYADRLLQFKNDRLDIINISQNIEFLEESYKYKGVTNAGSVCKTDFGIAWVNRFGVYLFDGSKIINLFEKNNGIIIDKDEWDSFVNYGKTEDSNYAERGNVDISPIIGWSPNKRQLTVVMGDSYTNENTYFYMCNLPSMSWTKSVAAQTGLLSSLDTSKPTTNFITMSDGHLRIGLMKSGSLDDSDSLLKVLDYSTNSQKFKFYTKAFDFGSPGVSKKITKVYFHYKGEGTKVNIVMHDDIGGTTNHYLANSAGIADANPLSDSTSTDTVESFKVYNNTAKNIKRIWFSFETNSNLTSDFDLYDINIVFRTKTVK